MYCGTPVGSDSPSKVEVPSVYVDPKPNKIPLTLEKTEEDTNKEEDFNWKLIECPSCHKEVSRFALSCPNCGHPFPENAPKSESTSSNTTSNNSNDSGGMGFWGIVMAVIVAIILISLF